MELKKVVEEIEGSRASKPKYVKSNLKKLKHLTGDSVDMGKGQIEIDGWTYRQILRRLSVPKALYDNIEQPTRDTLLRDLVARMQEDEGEAKLRAVGKQITAVLPIDYMEIETEVLVKELPEWDFVETQPNPNLPIPRFRAINREEEVEKGVFVGFEMVTSEIGGYPLTMELLLFQQICKNGMLRVREGGGAYFSIDQDLLMGAEVYKNIVKSVVRVLKTEGEKDKERIKTAQKEPTRNVSGMIDSWGELSIPRLVPKKMAARIAVEKQKPANVYELASLVSNVGRDLDNYKRRVVFERWAGQLMGIWLTDPATS